MNEVEEWRPVVGWEGWYEVSNMGQVRSLPRVGRGAYDSTRTFPSRVLVGCLMPNGYRTVNMRRPGEHVCKAVHALVARAFLGPKPEGMCVCHWNGVRNDNRASNLRWDTYKANYQDRYRHGTDARGDKNHHAKLTEAQVRQIMHERGRYVDIAKKYNVTPELISQIQRGRAWKHIGAEHGVVWSEPERVAA